MKLRNDKEYILRGMGAVLHNLDQQVKRIEGATMKGLIYSTIIIRRDMDFTPPTIPLDLGNLRASWFVVTLKTTPDGRSSKFTGKDASELSTDHNRALSSARSMLSGVNQPVLIMGFTANYAMWVHEMLGDINWSRPGSGAKFFEAALSRNTDVIVNTIWKYAKI